MNEPSPWISFERAQPKSGQAVLLRYVNGTIAFTENWRLDQCTVSKTHWMPVPALPKPDPFEDWWRHKASLPPDIPPTLHHYGWCKIAWDAGVQWARENPE